MEAIVKAIFEKVKNTCGDGGYAIIDSAEFADALPDGIRKSHEEIDGALKELQKGGFIDIKYARGDMYCVAALKNALPDEEEKQPAECSPTVIEVKEKFNVKAAALYSAFAFLGGAVGSAIISLIAMFV